MSSQQPKDFGGLSSAFGLDIVPSNAKPSGQSRPPTTPLAQAARQKSKNVNSSGQQDPQTNGKPTPGANAVQTPAVKKNSVGNSPSTPKSGFLDGIGKLIGKSDKQTKPLPPFTDKHYKQFISTYFDSFDSKDFNRINALNKSIEKTINSKSPDIKDIVSQASNIADVHTIIIYHLLQYNLISKYNNFPIFTYMYNTANAQTQQVSSGGANASQSSITNKPPALSNASDNNNKSQVSKQTTINLYQTTNVKPPNGPVLNATRPEANIADITFVIVSSKGIFGKAKEIAVKAVDKSKEVTKDKLDKGKKAVSSIFAKKQKGGGLFGGPPGISTKTFGDLRCAIDVQHKDRINDKILGEPTINKTTILTSLNIDNIRLEKLLYILKKPELYQPTLPKGGAYKYTKPEGVKGIDTQDQHNLLLFLKHTYDEYISSSLPQPNSTAIGGHSAYSSNPSRRNPVNRCLTSSRLSTTPGHVSNQSSDHCCTRRSYKQHP